MKTGNKAIIYFVIVIIADLFFSFVIFMGISSAKGMTIQHPGISNLFAEIFWLIFLGAFIPCMIIVGIGWLFVR